jgi:hypothetical protein|tara:strand:+ start:8779 stop:9243 length:465 start_codon:yes stop_codon:yes gene_type:complete
MTQGRIHWKAFEYEHKEKSPDWFWALGIIAVAVAVTAIILNNVLLAILVLVGAFTLALYAAKKPDEASFELNDRGVVINKRMYPYQTLESFCVLDEEDESPKLLIKSKKILMPHIVIPISNVHPTEVHSHLITYLEEEEQDEPFSHKIMEYLGF